MALEIGERLRGLTENLNLKLLSFATALVLYSLVHGSQEAQRTMSVDLVALLPPEAANRVLVSSLPPQVRVILRGSRSTLDDVHAEDVGDLQIDVHSGQERHVIFDKTQIHVPPGVAIDQVEPPALDLVWDDLIVRDVPAQVSVANTATQGFVVKGAPTATPENVRVRGPKTDVSAMQFVRVDAFDLSGLVEGEHTRTLALDKPQGRVTYDTRTVSVMVMVTRELAERSFTKLAIAVVGQTKAKTQPPDADVRLSCPPDIIHALRSEQVVPRVEVKSTTATGSESLPVIISVDKCEATVTPQSVIVRW